MWIIASALAAAKKTTPGSINGTLFGLVLSCERQVEVRAATDSGVDEKD